MNKKAILCSLYLTLMCGMAGCDKPAPKQASAPETSKPVSVEGPEVLRETLSQEIADTQTAIDEARQTQASLENEIALMKQLLDDTEEDLRASEDEVARLEALNKVQ